jgi:hypothetical protein
MALAPPIIGAQAIDVVEIGGFAQAKAVLGGGFKSGNHRGQCAAGATIDGLSEMHAVKIASVISELDVFTSHCAMPLGVADELKIGILRARVKSPFLK